MQMPPDQFHYSNMLMTSAPYSDLIVLATDSCKQVSCADLHFVQHVFLYLADPDRVEIPGTDWLSVKPDIRIKKIAQQVENRGPGGGRDNICVCKNDNGNEEKRGMD